MIRILVGDTDVYLHHESKKYSINASLINESNFQNLLPGTYYTSLGDFNSMQSFIQTLNQADEIIYCPPDKWSDLNRKKFSAMEDWTIFYCLYFKDRKIVKNIEQFYQKEIYEQILKLEDDRKTDQPQLWTVGCSVANGDFINKQDRYGQLISDHYKKPVSFLTAKGSSIQWAADQILRSDIRENDIVLWGITAQDRFPYFENNAVTHATRSYYEHCAYINKLVSIEVLGSDHMTYLALTNIYKVINFCKITKSHLFLHGIVPDRSFLRILHSVPNYSHLTGFFGFSPEFLDYGEDDRHPGPKTHEWFASELIKKIDTYFENLK